MSTLGVTGGNDAAASIVEHHGTVRSASWLRAIRVFVVRDTRLLLRRPSRIAATILTPTLIWLFFAGGFAQAAAASQGADSSPYTLSLASGAALLVVTFTSIFG